MVTVASLLGTTTRPPRGDDYYEPCEYEDGRGFKWVWIDGAIPPAQARRPYWICRHSAGGVLTNCPFPARMCRPKQEVEK